MCWVITVSQYGYTGRHRWQIGPVPVGVAATEQAARALVTEHGTGVGCYLDDWEVQKVAGEVVSVGLEGDDVEVVATRWEVKT